MNIDDERQGGVFIMRGVENDALSPSQWGYWSVRWAIDNASAEVDYILEKATLSGDSIFFKRMRSNSFGANLQLISLYTAVYWVYANLVLRMPADLIKYMAQGTTDGVKDIRTPSGEALDEGLIGVFNHSFKKYCLAMSSDFGKVEDIDPMAFNPDVSLLSQAFLHLIGQVYCDKGESELHVVDRLLLSHLIADIPSRMFKGLHEEMGVTFRAK